MIAETGVGEEGGDKPEWISSALEREAPAFSHIRALAWFNDVDTHADLRVDSSRASLAAFRKAIASPRYAGTRATLLATPASLAAGDPAPSPPDDGYGAPSFLEEQRLKLHGKYLALAIGIGVAIVVVAGALVLGLRRSRSHRAARGGAAG